jgi:hypothetical protein
MPDAYIDGHGLGKGGSVSGRGTWELESTHSGYGVIFNIADGGTMPKSLYSGTSILIKGRKPPYRIEVQLGDPDSRESITFEK